MLYQLSDSTGYTPQELYWNVPQEEVETLLLSKARAKEDEYKSMVSAVAMGAGFMMGGKKGQQAFEQFMRKTSLPTRRKHSHKALMEEMEKYRVDIPDKK